MLFTGDLTQRGSEAEFALLTEQLEGLWTHLDSLGSKPSLVTVPGNHDLTRPDPKDPAVRLLTKWGDDTSVIREFWDDPDSPYRKVVDRAFANYSEMDRQPLAAQALDARWSAPGGLLVDSRSQRAKHWHCWVE